MASPGIRNYEEHGGVGVLVYDIDNGYKFVKRLPTWDVPAGQKPENVKGVAASAKTGKVYVTSLNRMMALDAITGKKLWDKTYEGGCDRMAISPDGKLLYVPQLEGPFWTSSTRPRALSSPRSKPSPVRTIPSTRSTARTSTWPA